MDASLVLNGLPGFDAEPADLAHHRTVAYLPYAPVMSAARRTPNASHRPGKNMNFGDRRIRPASAV